jgi:hypothetical protein
MKTRIIRGAIFKQPAGRVALVNVLRARVTQLEDDHRRASKLTDAAAELEMPKPRASQIVTIRVGRRVIRLNKS